MAHAPGVAVVSESSETLKSVPDRIVKAANLDGLKPHDLRRTCISRWASKLPIHMTGRLAGHVAIQTTSKFYLGFTAEDLAAARKAVGESLTC